MAQNQTIESPNFEKVSKEAGQFTSDAVSLLWNALNDTRQTERRDFRTAQEMIAPKVLLMSPSANQDNVDTEGASVISFTGAASVNVTGFRAPSTGQTRVLFCQINGAGTITFVHNATSEEANRLVLSTGANMARATNSGIIFAYLSSRWREIGRTHGHETYTAAGTWTPTLTFTTPGDLSVAYTTRVGNYYRDGNLVHASFYILTSTFTHTTAAGNLIISGFPVAASSAANYVATAPIQWQTVTLTAGQTDVIVRLDAGASACYFITGGTGAASQALGTANAPTGSTLLFEGSITYITS